MGLKINNNKLEGYVAVWDSPSLPIPGIGIETVKRGAFSKALASGKNIRALNGHDQSQTVGSTKAGTLKVKEDETGLFVSIDLPDTTVARDLKSLIAAGEEFGGSFGAQKGKYIPTKEGRILTEVDVMEVTITPLPCYEATMARSQNFISEDSKEFVMEQTNNKAEEVVSSSPKTETKVEVIERSQEMSTPEFKPITPNAGVVGLNTKEREQYSILRAIKQIKEGKQLDGIERECSDEIARQVGHSPNGHFYMPAAELNFAGPMQRAAVNTTTGAGILTTQWTDFVDVLKNQLAFSKAGGRVLSGLVGTVKIPKQTATGSTYYVTEGNAVTESEPTATGVITLSPKTMGTWSKIERSMYLQTSYNAEQFVRQDMVTNMAIAMDAACFSGTGANGQPEGLFHLSTVSDYTQGTTLSYADLVGLESYVADLNNDLTSGSWSIVTTPKVRGKAKVTPVLGSTYPQFIWENNSILGYNTVISNQAKCATDEYNSSSHNLIFGDFSQAILGTWAGIDVQVDTITYATSGAVRLIALTDFDFQVRRTEAFACIENITVS